MQNIITPKHLEKALSYSEYRKLHEKLVAENKTTGPDQSAEMIGYTKLNFQRTQRIEKTVKLLPETIDALQNYATPLVWVVLSEPWCGDAAQNLPVLAKMTDASPNIEMYILLRDENPEIMDAYLTNGSRSIPKLIALKKEDMREVFTWGSRPKPAQEIYFEYKKNPDETKAQFYEKLHSWYAKDKGIAVQNEVVALMLNG